MKINKLILLIAVVAILVLALPTLAAVSFNVSNGTGFVGKGDVQTALGWNNGQLQQNAGSVVFTYEGTVTTEAEYSWTCTNTNNQSEQVRHRDTTTTTTVSGVVSSVARERNQITGFNLTGYSGSSSSSSSSSSGPALNSCPAGPWSLTTPASDASVTTSSSGTLKVNGVPIG